MAKVIMLVMDDPHTLLSIKSALEIKNYVVLTATTQEECLDKLNGDKIDLILIEALFPRNKIITKVGNSANIRYLLTKNTLGVSEGLFSNVIAFSESPKGVKNFLKAVKRATRKW